MARIRTRLAGMAEVQLFGIKFVCPNPNVFVNGWGRTGSSKQRNQGQEIGRGAWSAETLGLVHVCTYIKTCNSGRDDPHSCWVQVPLMNASETCPCYLLGMRYPIAHF
jgi:hypothetical protein